MFQKIARYLVSAIIFLIPLFTLPFTANVLDFQKQFLLLLLALSAVFFWVGGMVGEKKIVIKYNATYILVFAFLAVLFASSLLSQYGYGSLWGSLSVADSFGAGLGMVLLYILITNLYDKKQAADLILIAAVSGALAAIYALFQSFGLYLVPFGYAKNASFNTVGSAGALVFALAIMFCLVLPMLFSAKGWRKWVLIVCETAFVVDIILFNIVLTWVVLGIGSLASFLFSMSSDEFAKKYRNAKTISFFMLALSIVFVCVNFFASDILANGYQAIYKQIGVVNQPTEIYLSQPASFNIAISAMRQSAKSFFLGTGPGTFVYDFVRYRPVGISQSELFWNVRFTAGASEAVNVAATKGILGLLAMLAIFGFIAYKGFKTLTEDRDNAEISLVLFSGWLAIAIAFFLYPFNLTMLFLLWLMMGLWGIISTMKSKTLEMRTIKTTYIISLLMILLLVVEIGFMVWFAKCYYAEGKYLQALTALQKNDIDGAMRGLEAAAAATQNMQDNYLSDLAQIYLAKSSQITNDMTQQNASASDIGNAIAPYISGAVQAAQIATDRINPNNVVNWSVRGSIMLQLAALGVPGETESWAQKSFEKALQLEPSNPVLWTQMGQVMLIKKDIDSAKTNFAKAVELNPRYSNARYYLGLIDDQQGDKQVAIEQFTLIAKLNPDNELIMQILQNLQDGKPALGQAPDATQNNIQLPAAPQPSLEEQLNPPGALPTPENQGELSTTTPKKK